MLIKTQHSERVSVYCARVRGGTRSALVFFVCAPCSQIAAAHTRHGSVLLPTQSGHHNPSLFNTARVQTHTKNRPNCGRAEIYICFVHTLRLMAAKMSSNTKHTPHSTHTKKGQQHKSTHCSELMKRYRQTRGVKPFLAAADDDVRHTLTGLCVCVFGI